jgi:hypothetical protein
VLYFTQNNIFSHVVKRCYESQLRNSMQRGEGRKHREVEGVAMCHNRSLGAIVPQRPLALIVQLPNRDASMPSPQTVFTGSERFLLDVLKRALCELLKWSDLELSTFCAIWHAYLATDADPSKMPAWAHGCPNVLSHGHDVQQAEAYIRFCEACSLLNSSKRACEYAKWETDYSPDCPRFPPVIPENTLDLENGLDSPIITIEESDRARPELQWLSETQARVCTHTLTHSLSLSLSLT